MTGKRKHALIPQSTFQFASGGQKPFREKVSGLPKAFYNGVFIALSFT